MRPISGAPAARSSSSVNVIDSVPSRCLRGAHRFANRVQQRRHRRRRENRVEIGLRRRLVETNQQVSGLDMGAVLDQDLLDDAAGRVLDFFHARFDDQGAGGDDGARQLGGRRHGAEAGDQDERRARCRQQVAMDRRLRRRFMR